MMRENTLVSRNPLFTGSQRDKLLSLTPLDPCFRWEASDPALRFHSVHKRHTDEEGRWPVKDMDPAPLIPQTNVPIELFLSSHLSVDRVY